VTQLATTTAVDEIQQLKGQLDDGIITKEKVNTKKQQLLEL